MAIVHGSFPYPSRYVPNGWRVLRIPTTKWDTRFHLSLLCIFSFHALASVYSGFGETPGISGVTDTILKVRCESVTADLQDCKILTRKPHRLIRKHAVQTSAEYLRPAESACSRTGQVSGQPRLYWPDFHFVHIFRRFSASVFRLSRLVHFFGAVFHWKVFQRNAFHLFYIYIYKTLCCWLKSQVSYRFFFFLLDDSMFGMFCTFRV